MPESPLVRNPGNRPLSPTPGSPCHSSWAGGEAKTSSQPDFTSSPSPSNLASTVLGGTGAGHQDGSFREAVANRVPRDVSGALLGTSAISGNGQRSHSKLREKRRGSALILKEQGAECLTFPAPEGGVFPPGGLRGMGPSLGPSLPHQ